MNSRSNTIEDTGEGAGRQKTSSCGPGVWLPGSVQWAPRRRCRMGQRRWRMIRRVPASPSPSTTVHIPFTQKAARRPAEPGHPCDLLCRGRKYFRQRGADPADGRRGTCHRRPYHQPIKLSWHHGCGGVRGVQKTDKLVRELTSSGTEFIRPPFSSWKRRSWNASWR